MCAKRILSHGTAMLMGQRPLYPNGFCGTGSRNCLVWSQGIFGGSSQRNHIYFGSKQNPELHDTIVVLRLTEKRWSINQSYKTAENILGLTLNIEKSEQSQAVVVTEMKGIVPRQIYTTQGYLWMVLCPHENTVWWLNHISEKIYLPHWSLENWKCLWYCANPGENQNLQVPNVGSIAFSTHNNFVLPPPIVILIF